MALSQKRCRFGQLQIEELCQLTESSLSTYAAVSLHIALNHLKYQSQRFLGLILGRSQIFGVVFTTLNRSLKSDRQKYTPYGCVHIEVFHLLRLTSTWTSSFLVQSDQLAIVPHLLLAPLGTVVKPAQHEFACRPSPSPEAVSRCSQQNRRSTLCSVGGSTGFDT